MGIVAKIVPIGKGCLLYIALLSIAACSTTVSPTQVTTFGQGVDTAKVQTDTTFAAINQLVTEDEINRAIALPTFTENDVPVVLPPQKVAQWDRAFASIHQYVANLTLLLSPDQAKGFGTATVGLASSLASLSKPDSNLLPSTPVATSFAELGRLLIEAKADSDALQVARTVDPAMQSIFNTMAAAIGDNLKPPGLRGFVWQHWSNRLTIQNLAINRLKGEDRRPALLTYLDLLNKRDTQDLQLSSLRQSYLDLGAAHSALARGSNVDLNAAINRIQQELEATRALQQQFNELQPKTPEK